LAQDIQCKKNTEIFIMKLLVTILPFSIAMVGAVPATLSNVALPLDQHSEQLITGEATAMVHNNEYWFYFNNWGSCPGVDCCDSAAGCATCCFNNPPHSMQACSNPYGLNHTVQAYRTLDFHAWENMGVALPQSSRHPGIEFRPAVVYNPKTQLFVMWYEDRATGLSGYAIATSPTPQGPFTTTHTNVVMPGRGRTGDYNIFVDDDGAAYHVRTGFDIVRLNVNFTGPAEHVASFSTPKSSEGPTMFKRNGTYYITAGTGCCACIGGSSIYVLKAPKPEGPWSYQADVGSNPTPFDAHSKTNFVTKAQGSAVFKVGDQHVYLGNQWNSGLSQSPPGPRNHDLLYWGVIGFEDGNITQFVWQDEVSIEVPGATSNIAV